MDTVLHTKVLIIGAGPAGYTAAIYAARANLSPIQILGLQPGGQLMITTEVENFPGFANVIQGPWLMEQMKLQAEHVGTRMVHDLVTHVDFSRRPFVCTTDSGQVYAAETVIIATGAKARWLHVPGEAEYSGRGVSACATCDGFFFRGKNVAIVGGGNTAVEEALFLTNFCNKVTLVHRRDSLRAERIMQERLFNNPKMSFIWNAAIDEVTGDAAGVTGVTLRDVRTGEKDTLAVDGLFVAIGHDPATEIFKAAIETDEHGYIVTEPDSTATSVPGVFAAGDVKDKIYRQAVTAAGMGCMAALEADRFLAMHEETGIAAAAE